ncbi:hypothetical protein Aple_010820 [Acrocarpospora pleiomorpha]|uniref:Uncharacterized protein n=1 Tax=Acrocarpospora pleiomorpha TaxID=90975 RepID=A0A5M3X8Y4_9ACTN|nr:hypothetical protein [Acrocarpospora pleiomorpha]GES18187.1 hypothetical protein Aple_010820 [Acrocarpospora pleiomorpha]
MAQLLQTWDVELGYTGLTGLEEGRPEDVPIGGEPMWCIYHVHKASGAHVDHAFPHSLFEWRCAEYGIKPGDVDTLLEVAQYEPFIPDPRDTLVFNDEAARAILQEIHGLPGPHTPGVSDETRRQAHLHRIQAVKTHRIKIAAAPRKERQDALIYVGSRRQADPHPLDPIRQGLSLDPHRVAARQLTLDHLRASKERFVLPSHTLKPPGGFVGMQLPALLGTA